MQSFTREQICEYNPAVTLFSFKNLHSWSLFQRHSPVIGAQAWNLSPRTEFVSAEKQWLIWRLPRIAEDEQTDVYGAFNNTFNFNHGWMASVEIIKVKAIWRIARKEYFLCGCRVTKVGGDRMSVQNWVVRICSMVVWSLETVCIITGHLLCKLKLW